LNLKQRERWPFNDMFGGIYIADPEKTGRKFCAAVLQTNSFAAQLGWVTHGTSNTSQRTTLPPKIFAAIQPPMSQASRKKKSQLM
jgi:hypothetical protein